MLLGKTIILGDTGCGKTSLLQNYMGMSFTEGDPATIGVEFGSKVVNMDPVMTPDDYDKYKKIIRQKELPYDKDQSPTIKQQIWDTAGQERFHSVITSYYRGVQAAMFVCDLTNRVTYQHLDYWIEDFTKLSNVPIEEVACIIVGNKSDLVHQQHVTEKDLQAISEKYNMPYFIVSAKKDKTKVSEVFQLLAQMIFKKYLENPDSETTSYIEYLKIQNYAPKSSWCCTG